VSRSTPKKLANPEFSFARAPRKGGSFGGRPQRGEESLVSPHSQKKMGKKQGGRAPRSDLFMTSARVRPSPTSVAIAQPSLTKSFFRPDFSNPGRCRDWRHKPRALIFNHLFVIEVTSNKLEKKISLPGRAGSAWRAVVLGRAETKMSERGTAAEFELAFLVGPGSRRKAGLPVGAANSRFGSDRRRGVVSFGGTTAVPRARQGPRNRKPPGSFRQDLHQRAPKALRWGVDDFSGPGDGKNPRLQARLCGPRGGRVAARTLEKLGAACTRRGEFSIFVPRQTTDGLQNSSNWFDPAS